MSRAQQLARRLPQPARGTFAAIYRLRPSQRRYARGLQDRLRVSRLVADMCSRKVARGPFTGLEFGSALTTDLSSKCLGSYENELHVTLERLIGRRYGAVINVGCTEGYYAVGLAMRIPDAQVFAYDINLAAQAQCAEVARLNGVGRRVTIAGECSAESLASTILDSSLIVMDCEGCEFSLLDPAEVPALSAADMVVELHGFLGFDQDEFLSRFTSTHTISVVDSVVKNPAEFSELAGLDAADQRLAVFERPEIMQWAVLERRRSLQRPKA